MAFFLLFSPPLSAFPEKRGRGGSGRPGTPASLCPGSRLSHAGRRTPLAPRRRGNQGRCEVLRPADAASSPWRPLRLPPSFRAASPPALRPRREGESYSRFFLDMEGLGEVGVKLKVCLFCIKKGENKNCVERPPAPRPARRRARPRAAWRGVPQPPERHEGAFIVHKQ